MKIDESVIDKVLDNKELLLEKLGKLPVGSLRKKGVSICLDDWTVRWKSLQKRCRKMLDFLLFPA